MESKMFTLILSVLLTFSSLSAECFTVQGQETVPLAGASVKASGPGSGSAVTDQDGFYRIEEGLFTGKYEVTASAKGYISKTLGDINVTEGEETSGVDLTLDPSGIIEGMILDAETGKPVANAVVEASGLERYGYSAVSMPDGRYRVDTNLASGEYTVTAIALGYITATIDNVKVESGKITSNVNLNLRKSAVIKGKVTDEGGEPVVGAIVMASITNVSEGSFCWSAITDSDGNYELNTNLDAGTYNVTVLYAEGCIHSSKTVTVERGETATLDFILEKSGVISGVILDSDTRQPIPNATIIINDVPEGAMVIMPITRTDEDGRFSFNMDLTSGTYGLLVLKTGYITDSELTKNVEDTTVWVEVTAGMETSVEIYLKKMPSAIITGTVKDEDGKPIANALIEVQLGIQIPSPSPIPIPPETCRTDSQGKYRIDAGLTTPGTYKIRASADGFKSQEQSVEITMEDIALGGTKIVDFTLQRFISGIISGRVYGVPIDSSPPVMSAPSQNPPPDSVQPGQQVKISVNVTDAGSGVKNVTLHYTNGTAWYAVPMNFNETSALWEAMIPGHAEDTQVKYKIEAYDNVGNHVVDDNSGQYYIYVVVPEFPPSLIILLFIMATLTAVIIPRKNGKPESRRLP